MAEYTYDINQQLELTMDETWILQDALEELEKAIDNDRSKSEEVNKKDLTKYRNAVQQLANKIESVYCAMEDEVIARGLVDDLGTEDGQFPQLR